MTRNGADHEGGRGGGRGRTGRAPGAGHQQLGNERFHDRARRWEEVYQREDLPVTPERLGVRLNARLQRLADNGVPGIRAGGGQYLVLARAPVRAADAADAADPAG
jgi:hypothetical protein